MAKIHGIVPGMLFLLMVAPLYADSLEERVQRIEHRVSRVSPLTLDVEALKRENQRLRGRIEEQQHAIDALRQKLQEMYLDLDQRIMAIQSGAAVSVPESALVTVAAETGDSAQSQATDSGSVPSDPESAKAAYDAAYRLLGAKQRRYQDAIAAFEQFLLDYPDSDLADNAMYWKAEASYVTGDNETALKVFQELIQRYPESPKLPGALLKSGYIHYAQQRIPEAREVLQRVIREYPASSAADMAKQRLDRIAREAR